MVCAPCWSRSASSTFNRLEGKASLTFAGNSFSNLVTNALVIRETTLPYDRNKGRKIDVAIRLVQLARKGGY